MRRLLLAAVLPLLAGAACSGRRGPGASPFPAGGRFRAERVAQHTTVLINGPAWATYCPSESLLVIVALGGTWNGGVAVRVVPPFDRPRDYRIQPSLADTGTASAAFRAPAAGAARVGVGGTVHLAIGDVVNGRFEVTLPDSARAHVAIRGTVTRVPVSRLSAGTCNPP